MNILCIGDIFGRVGRTAFAKLLPEIKQEFAIDCVIVNGENAAAGAGITPKLAEELFAGGADVITLGDHTWDKKEIYPYLDDNKFIVRPGNFVDDVPGKGMCTIETPKGKVAVLNLLGRTFMKYNVNCPFRTFDDLRQDVPDDVDVVIVDMHAETTSEKVAFGWYADGRASVVFGTHTHIQTADEKILERGTAYISDLGMSGPYDSVIGSRKEAIIERFLKGIPCKFEAATRNVILHGVVVDVEEQTGKAQSIERIQRLLSEQPKDSVWHHGKD